MTDKQLLEEKYRAQLAEWRADIDKLKARAAQAQADARLDLESQVDDLEGKREAAKRKLDELRDAGDVAAAELKAGLEMAFDDLGRGVRSAMDAFSRSSGA
ncbi:MAG: coiled coil domain-containing protein [Gammaproteobacteria bacterium]|jgi:chromosome segregation ATPase